MSANVEYVSLTDSLLVSAGNVNYLAIRDSNITPAPKYAGLGSVNLGNNNGWDFSNTPGYGIAFYSVDGGNNENWIIVNTLVTGLNYLYIQDSAATPPYWWAGDNSVNGGNNTGWLFYSNRTALEDALLNDLDDSQFFLTSNAVESFTTAVTQTTQTNFNSAILEETELLDEAFTSNNTFNSAAVEAAVLDNTQFTANNTFNSAVVEPATLAESEIGVAIFAGVITEGATYNNSQAAQVNFNSIVLENSTILDISFTQNSVFNSSILENLVIVDGQIPRGWFKINDTQDANWTPINNTSG